LLLFKIALYLPRETKQKKVMEKLLLQNLVKTLRYVTDTVQSLQLLKIRNIITLLIMEIEKYLKDTENYGKEN
jgi:hypothetical protein